MEVSYSLSQVLAQVLRGGDKEPVLQMRLGGVRQECVDNDVIEPSCFPENSAARFFREKLCFEVSLDALNKLVNALKAGKMPQVFGIAYEEVLNAGLRLLPLYSPFTIFLNSLRLTPKPYLRLMYGKRLFDGGVVALMEKYGVKIGLRVAPGLGKELDEEFGLYGHENDTVGE